ncbi:MAG: hypothetical protein AAF707_01610 [Pseudomonadota bacterium]
MAIDPLASFGDAPSAPARDAFAISPHDSLELASVTKALYVGTAGDVVLRTVGGASDVTFANVPVGAILPVRAIAVRATGTTAANIVGLA